MLGHVTGVASLLAEGLSLGSGDGLSLGSGDGLGQGSGDSDGSGEADSLGSGDGDSPGSGEANSVGSGDGDSLGSGEGDAHGWTVTAWWLAEALRCTTGEAKAAEAATVAKTRPTRTRGRNLIPRCHRHFLGRP